ncbi:hypothetical protein [Bacillus sp. FJAT-44742]|uniref:hypothetical protein n=1 Tax=Bacillus sp. FJAT-44742 TaxID=2014005 RepID=UPI000C23DD30|nr:hypothetical protein [Bacillus sp. FJAT-44742]
MKHFGQIHLLETKVVTIKPYYSVVYYKLLYQNKHETKICTGKMILERGKQGWKIYSISEEDLSGVFIPLISPGQKHLQ